MKLPWFRRTGIFFIPSSISGWIIFFAAVCFSGYRFMVIDSKSHSASDTLMNFFFNLLIIGALYSLAGFFTSRKSGG